MPRSMWRGAISFGMVAIPVRLYLATESKSVSFRLLCPSCHCPVKQKRWCPHEEKEISWTEALRGYEVAREEFVVLDDADLEGLPLASKQIVEILEFVDDSDIDAGVYLQGAYYLEPEAVGVKPYYLLKKALERTGKVAIGKIALRDREHLCRLALHERGLVLNTLHWPDEIRDAGDLKLPEDEVSVHERELDLAVMLIDNLAATFDPSRYRDEYREALLRVVEAKLGDQKVERPAAAVGMPAMDLMAALKASVVEAKRRAPAVEAVGVATGRTATAARRQREAAPASATAEPSRRRRRVS